MIVRVTSFWSGNKWKVLSMEEQKYFRDEHFVNVGVLNINGEFSNKHNGVYFIFLFDNNKEKVNHFRRHYYYCVIEDYFNKDILEFIRDKKLKEILY